MEDVSVQISVLIGTTKSAMRMLTAGLDTNVERSIEAAPHPAVCAIQIRDDKGHVCGTVVETLVCASRCVELRNVLRVFCRTDPFDGVRRALYCAQYLIWMNQKGSLGVSRNPRFSDIHGHRRWAFKGPFF